jgi:hypothetical protein
VRAAPCGGMIDTRKCGTHPQATIEENGQQMFCGVRLKVDKEKISAIKAIVVRGEEELDVQAILDKRPGLGRLASTRTAELSPGNGGRSEFLIGISTIISVFFPEVAVGIIQIFH